MNIIIGLKNKVPMDVLLSTADPLGFFHEMANLKVLEGDDYIALYQHVLIDTPVGPYFMRFLEDSMEGLSESRTMNDVQQLFRDMSTEHIRTSLLKMWLEDFYEYCGKLDGDSKEMMQNLLKFEADLKSI